MISLPCDCFSSSPPKPKEKQKTNKQTNRNNSIPISSQINFRIMDTFMIESFPTQEHVYLSVVPTLHQGHKKRCVLTVAVLTFP